MLTIPHLQPHTNEVSFINDIKKIVDEGRRAAYASVNAIMIETYWHIGQRIVEQEQKGSARAEYGAQLIELLSAELTRTYGNGFSSRYLRAFRQFYIIFPDIEIWKSRFPNLTWTHIFRTLRVNDETAIRWYLEASAKEMWSVRTLDRNISTQYFERHFKQPQLLTSNSKTKKIRITKKPYNCGVSGV